MQMITLEVLRKHYHYCKSLRSQARQDTGSFTTMSFSYELRLPKNFDHFFVLRESELLQLDQVFPFTYI